MNINQKNIYRKKDQFFTKPVIAKECLKKFYDVTKNILKIDLSDYIFIEPSAGNGTFLKLLPKNYRIGFDIEPRHYEIIKQDYLKWKPLLNKKYIVIGNPPFGVRGKLALDFINHSFQFSDIVGFILPKLFNSDGKGVVAKRVIGYKLVDTYELPLNSFVYPDNTDVNVSVVFQVWSKINTQYIKKEIPKKCDNFIKVYSLSDGGTPGTTRNKKMLYKCDVYIPSTCFKGMKSYNHFEKLPYRRGYGIVVLKNKSVIKPLLQNTNWENISFKSTNGALNIRKSLIENVIIKQGYFN